MRWVKPIDDALLKELAASHDQHGLRFTNELGTVTCSNAVLVDADEFEENYGTDPQIEVDNAPQDAASGHDRQLETALATAMSLIETHKPGLPAFGEKPRRARQPLPKR